MLICHASFTVISDPCVRASWTAILPLALVGCLIIYRFILKKLKLSRWLPAKIQIFFSRFLTLREAEELIFEGKPTSSSSPLSVENNAPPKLRTFLFISISALQTISHLALGTYRLISEDLVHHQSTLYRAWCPFLLGLCWLYATIQPIRRYIITPQYDLLAFYVLFFFGLVAEVISIAYDTYVKDAFGATLFEVVWLACNIVCAITLLAMTFRLPISTPSSNIDREQIGKRISPEEYVPLWQWLTFRWVWPLIKRGWEGPIDEKDVWDIPMTMSSAPLLTAFQAIQTSSVVGKILVSNGFDLLLDTGLAVISVAFLYTQTYCMKRILEAITEGSKETRATAYIYAIVAYGAALSKAQLDLLHLWHARRASTRVRSELMACIYDKALKRKDFSGVVSSKSKKEPAAAEPTTPPKQEDAADVGKIVQLCSGDANTVSTLFSMVYLVFTSPLEIIIVSIFLYQLLGWAAFTGFAVFAVFIPLNAWLSTREVTLTKGLLAARDKRMGVINELIGAIKFLKFYAYEDVWTSKVFKERRAELAWLFKKRVNSIAMTVGFTAGPFLVSLVSFAFFVLQGKQLTISVAFTAIALYKAIEMPLGYLPWLLVQTLQAKVSVGRIQAFLDEGEVEDYVSSMKRPQKSDPPIHGLSISHATFRWNAVGKTTDNDTSGTTTPTSLVSPTASENSALLDSASFNSGSTTRAKRVFQLEDINVSFPEGQLSIVTGPTGSGKTALLMALLGEMTCLPGGVQYLPKDTMHVDENGYTYSISYCAQTPWLQQQSIKDNVLFGSPLDETRYEEVLDCCALKPDLAILEDGDLTEIGSRGVSLSGGQKARVALARAVYARTRYVVLDDVFAAVDSHTARFLFDRLICGPLMQHRTIVIVTHHVELVLPAVGYVVRMLDGYIDVQGTTAELRERKLLQSIVHDEEANAETPKPDAGLEAQESVTATFSDAGDTKITETKKPRDLITTEARAVGRVSSRVYMVYMKATSYYLWLIVLVLAVMFEFLGVGEKVWVKIWADHYPQEVPSSILRHQTATSYGLSFMHQPTHIFSHPHQSTLIHHYGHSIIQMINSTFTEQSYSPIRTNLPSAEERPGFYIGVYGTIGLLRVLVSTLLLIVEYYGAFRASKSLFGQLLKTVVGTTMRWIDTTPSGRILNRFSRDVETLDQSLSETASGTIGYLLTFVATVVTVAVFLPPFILPAVFIAYGYYYLAAGYLAVGRDLRRLEANNRSPLLSGFSDLLEGITTVRSFSAEKRFLNDFHHKVDITTTLWHNTWMTNRWLLFNFDLLGGTSVFLATLLSLSGYIDAGFAGLVITSAQQFTMSVYWTSRIYTQLEMDLNSVERIAEWLELPQEPAGIIEGTRPPAYWPSSSNSENFVVVEDLVLKYAPELEPVLHGVSFTLRAKERIGLIGRTGSGKSTLAMAFLRFVDPEEGRILIDGIDICKIGLQDLRSKLTIIPQDAVLFSGTIRENLDPFNDYDDETCLQALQRVHLSTGTSDLGKASRKPSYDTNTTLTVVESAASSSANSGTMVLADEDDEKAINLATEVSVGGSNFSQGQRQLIAMARALLRQNGSGGSITIMDESTSSVDFETDAKIQQTIREEFANSLLITIAHRIRTIIDYDRLIVLDKGKIVEFDSPAALIEKEGGIFRDMCLKSGMFGELHDAALAASKYVD